MTNSGASYPPIAENAPPRERLRLSGRSVKLDPATHAVRGDIADIELAHQVFAPHYARALPHRAIVATPVLIEANDNATTVANLALEDRFDVLDISGGFAWGKTATGIPGYVPMAALRLS